MKNYVEISAVVLFAILVHSALTASLVNIFMTLHGVGGGGGGLQLATTDNALYFSDALRRTNGVVGDNNDNVSSSSSSTTGQRDDSWRLVSYNFQQQSVVAKKKIVSDDTNISLETYSAMLMKQRQSEGVSDDDDAVETIESLRLRAKQSKFRYMR
eukprot:scaffold10578_cov158-Skeletonema_menzelii.AAC.13